MQVRCMMCGRKEDVAQDNVDYKKYEKNPKAVYICTLCSARTFHEAKEGQKPHKPM